MPGAAPSSRLPFRSPAWLLLPILAVRGAGFAWKALDIDETDFLVCARMMAEGAVPYVGFVEKKPILSYLFFAPAGALGFDLWPAQLLAVAWVLATSVVVGRAARRWLGGEEAEWAGAWLACLAQVACVPAVNTETMLNLPAAGALYFFVRSEREGRIRHDLAAGLCIGLATLFKHQAGILLVALLAAHAWGRSGLGPRAGRAAALLAGFIAPWALAAAAFAALGHLGAFVEWNVWRNLSYGGHSVGPALPRLLEGLAVGVLLAAPLQWWLALAETRDVLRGPSRDPLRVGLVLALWLTFIPVSLGQRFYGHYFIQFAPIAALLSVPGALRLLAARNRLPAASRRLVAAAVALPPAIFLAVAWGGGLLGRFPLQEPRTRQLAGWLRTHTAPGDRLFVWGHYTPIYVLSRRLPGTRYYNTSVQIGDFDPHHLPDGYDLSRAVSQRDVSLALQDLETNRPAIFVDTAPADIHDWHRVPLSVVPPLKRYVDEHYALVASPAGAAVYRRR